MTRVLLVDDQRAFAERLKDRLTALRCDVAWVTTAEACFEAASKDPPHLILLSSNLGSMSGLMVCNGLKRDRQLKRIPLIIMSLAPLADLAEHRALPTRADAYVRKADDLRSVLDEVRAVIASRRKKRKALEGRKPPPSSRRSGPGDGHPGSEQPERERQPKEDKPRKPHRNLDLVLTLPSETEQAEQLRADAAAEIARLESEIDEQQTIWAAAVKAARTEQAEEKKRADQLDEQLEALAATTRSQAKQIQAMEEDKAAEVAGLQVALDTAEFEIAREREKLDGLDHVTDPLAREYIDQLEKVHAAEVAETERIQQEEVERLETELASARKEREAANDAKEELASEMEELRAEKLDALERVEALEDERSRLIEKISNLKSRSQSGD